MVDRVGIGLLGMGTVGAAVARRMLAEWQLLGERAGAVPVLRRVAVRDRARLRDIELPETVTIDDDPLAVVDDPGVTVVVEAMGGLEPATSCIERALEQGKHVVTANKAVVATHGPRLACLAGERHAGLRFEAAVGAGLPVLALLRESLQGDRISAIDSIINGTTNVILTRMRRDGMTVSAALEEAQQRGYAEADPNSDIDGWDAAYKLVIMSWLAFGVHVAPEDVDRRGIRGIHRDDIGYAGRLGCALKLLASAALQDGRLALSVRPTLVPESHPLFDVDDSENGVVVRSDLASTVMLRGLGAGGDSTASAVVSDIVQAVRHRDSAPDSAPPEQHVELAGPEDIEIHAYLRVQLADIAEARALVVQALEDRGVPVLDVLDAPSPERGAQLIALTGPAPRAVHDRAVETVETLAAVRSVAAYLDRVA